MTLSGEGNSPAATTNGIGHEGMVTVWDEHGRYVGCMGIEVWKQMLSARKERPDEEARAAESLLRDFAEYLGGERGLAWGDGEPINVEAGIAYFIHDRGLDEEAPAALLRRLTVWTMIGSASAGALLPVGLWGPAAVFWPTLAVALLSIWMLGTGRFLTWP